jgi:hypothetical protein
MNRGLFENAGIERERGGVPVPAQWMPLRFAYEGMVVTQATRNPFDLERIRIQRRVDTIKAMPAPLAEPIDERFEVMKTALQLLVGADATSPSDAEALAERLTAIARGGTMLELESLEIRPDSPDARPLSDYFVNKRIELLVEEAKSFRTDYRNEELGRRTDIFLALKKPWMDRDVPTVYLAAVTLGGTSLLALALTSGVLIVQNRRTR